ncbi:hypothetical protein PS645_00380 [Pseudomonas fluorescens]|uniref:Lipoprotein n=1 Tax=Pseudomonas fluorescens TaxID=294 RepID=A0A5E6PJL4_PSEFL|nr:hypothetical protein [Pseudomonas fluorescens]VVM43651.1 hypothetical protein PS645_00380 [Pseudomonas fluorescens]
MNKLIIYSLLGLFMTGCSSSGHQAAADAHAAAPASAKQLNASEINSTVIGRQHSSVTSTGYPFSETLNPDGTAVINISGESTQKGNWVITKDVICVSYQKYGKECNKVLSDGNSFWFVDSTTNKTNNKFSVK